ncbi:electron transfer flavoprotein subunit alpha/FixB family protein [Pseudomonas fluorescens]|uniref:electron transfer flavoprotein subunit alpha/FixB family protein n=1 Tax=Pseudomonas fluorescens TaxID=294 RepID=UPI003F9796E8
MTTVLIYVEARDNVVQPITHELINAARGLASDAEVVAAVLSAAGQSLGEQLKGVDRVVEIQHANLSSYNPEAHAIGLACAVEQVNPDLVLLGYTTAGLDLGSLLAIKTSRALVGYCTELNLEGSELFASSQLYRGKLVAKTKVQLPAIAVVVPGSFDDTPSDVTAPASAIIDAPQALDQLRVRFVSLSAPDADEVDLTRAERIVCVGRGIGGEDKIEEASQLAALLGAEIAGSRPVIDSGWLPKARQVGKSGQKVKPKLYIALGVSGAPEHLEGMKNADYIIAINSDEKAPIFEVADIGIACDIFELLPALCERLGVAGEAP